MTAKAIQSFKQAASIFPEYERPYIECANCLRKMGRDKEAVTFLEKSVELIPESIKTHSQARGY
jgi:tetratricopeptide (TPR) repeat protein